jgi:hypothetical protein
VADIFERGGFTVLASRTVGHSLLILAVAATSSLAVSGSAGAKVVKLPKPPPLRDFRHGKVAFALGVSDSPSDPSNYCVPGLGFYIGKAQKLGLPFFIWSTGAGEGTCSLNANRTQLEMTATYPVNASGTATWNGSSYVGLWVSPPTGTFYSNFSVTVGSSCPSGK